MRTVSRPAPRRGVLPALLAVFCLLLSLFSAARSSAASPYLPVMERLVEWGVMSGYPGGDLAPDNPITRAEFVSLVNRAYGYNETGPTPFTDVPGGAWYADDVAIAYNTGYFSGTSSRTASPNNRLTREQAMVLLAHNLRLDDTPGEVTEFSDGREFSSWSRGYVKSAVNKGLISGYEDGSFRPEQAITRGEMSVLLYRALGNLISSEGTHTLSDVFGNVTISTPNATLRNTTVAGDLFISGGLGLGDVMLDNVRVLGSIVVAGGGESESGGDSVVLRNVEADNLIVDNITGQYLAVRAEGDTVIKNASVRSDAYIQDRTQSGKGLLNISLDSADNYARYNLSGNLETVVNRSLGSSLNVSQGTLKSLTVDEQALGSSLSVSDNATVKALNLDTATPVTGQGDVETINVNTAGSTVAMLPDNIVIRPGVTASVYGETMNTTLGQEASADPHLLAGYPKATNVAPTSATAVFSANKSGTVYWAVSATTDGSVGETDLISPPSYGNKIVRSGSTGITASNTEFTAAITGLTAGGSYYLSTVMVDARGTHSPVKVTSFTAPDNTVPAFGSGYPAFDKVTSYSAQAVVVATKSCNLYYAIYAKGSTAPKPADFRSGSLSSSLGSGVRAVTRNIPDLFTVNKVDLDELESYDVYFWLCDADGAQSSAVVKKSFTTVDETPPYFTLRPQRSGEATATAIPMTCTLNEDGTVYWVAVPTGTDYPRAQAGTATVSEEAARIQIAGGGTGSDMKSGKITVKADTPAKFTISGLKGEMTYDIWYVAVDNAKPTGNYASILDPANTDIYAAPKVKFNNWLSESTLDTNAPSAAQEFTKRTGEGSSMRPYPDTDIQIIFNENIQHSTVRGSTLSAQQPLALYNKILEMELSGAETGTEDAKKELEDTRSLLADTLADMLVFYDKTSPGQPVKITGTSLERRANNLAPASWVIDYRYATVEQEGTRLIITFPTKLDSNGDVSGKSALNLGSGSTYYFHLQNIADSPAGNSMTAINLEDFTTVSAIVWMANIASTVPEMTGTYEESANYSDVGVHMAFSLTPESTASVDANTRWDLLLWSDTSVEFEVYRRSREVTGGDVTPWEKLANRGRVTTNQKVFLGQSVQANLNNRTVAPTIVDTSDDPLTEGRVYEYVIHFTEVEGSTNADTWNQEVNFHVNVITGDVMNLAAGAGINAARYQSMLTGGLISSIGSVDDANDTLSLLKAFSDTAAPNFTSGRPIFTPADTSMSMQLLLDRNGMVHYLIAPAGDIPSKVRSSDTQELTYGSEAPVIPTSGSASNAPLAIEVPGWLSVVNAKDIYNQTTYPDFRYGSQAVTGGAVTVNVKDLTPDTEYFAYFILQGSGQTYSDRVLIYKFKTQFESRPSMTVNTSGNIVVNVTSRNMDATGTYALFLRDSLPSSTLGKELNASPLANSSDLETVNNLLASAGVEVDSGYNGYRVYQTMFITQRVNGYDYSLFDLYFDPDFKDQCADDIMSTGSVTGRHTDARDRDLARNRQDSVDWSATSPAAAYDLNYVCFVVAWSSGARNATGDSRGFRSTYDIYRTDESVPQIRQVINSGLTVTYDTSGYNLSGTFNLYFSKDLYFRNQSTNARYTILPYTAAQIRTAGLSSTCMSVQDLRDENLDGSENVAKLTIQTNATGAPSPTDTTQIVRVQVNGASMKTSGNNATVSAMLTFKNGLASRGSSSNTQQLLQVEISYNPTTRRVTISAPESWCESQTSWTFIPSLVGAPAAVEAITLSPSPLTLKAGESKSVTAALVPSAIDAATKSIVWTTDSSALTISPRTGADVTVTASSSVASVTSATVTVTVDGVSETLPVTINPVVSEIWLNGSRNSASITINASGDNKTVTASAQPTSLSFSDRELTYSITEGGDLISFTERHLTDGSYEYYISPKPSSSPGTARVTISSKANSPVTNIINITVK